MSNKKAKGKRAKTRSKARRRRAKATVNKKLRSFRKGSRVMILIDTSIHSAMPPLRYQGMTGTVQGKRGSVFTVELKEGSLSKYLIVHPAHLSSVSEGTKQQDEEKEELKAAGVMQ